jgi:uncharacterized membrane protein YkvA (DUF1232 family)
MRFRPQEHLYRQISPLLPCAGVFPDLICVTGFMDNLLSGVCIQMVERQMIKQHVKQLERLLYKEEAMEVVEINNRHLVSYKSGEARA